MEKTCPYIDAVKIGYPPVLGSGLSVVRGLVGFDLPLIDNFKVADIPPTRALSEQFMEIMPKNGRG